MNENGEWMRVWEREKEWIENHKEKKEREYELIGKAIAVIASRLMVSW